MTEIMLAARPFGIRKFVRILDEGMHCVEAWMQLGTEFAHLDVHQIRPEDAL